MIAKENVQAYIERLEQYVQAWSGNIRLSDAPWHMLNMYGTVARFAITCQSPELSLAAAQFLPALCRMVRESDTRIDGQSADYMLRVLAQEQCVKALKTVDGGNSAAAWLICRLVANYAFNPTSQENAPKQELLFQFLEHWSGKEFPKEKPLNLASVCIFLYGPACWDIYGYAQESNVDAKTVTDTINDIATANPPIVFDISANVSRSDELNVPDSLL